MKKHLSQPARKSYFFEQGFIDIKNAIKLSWVKNAKTTYHYYQKSRQNGGLSLKGIYYLWCALSVVIFGTLFFTLISSVMLAVVCVFFALVYMAFILVWIIDRIYLTRHKIFSACYECKTKSLIPTYICPHCQEKHSNLTPGVYGILYRTCQCGEKLPTTFFNGRKNLKAICPHCLSEGRTTLLNDRESRPFCIPVIGGRSTGKTAYITAFSRTFIEDVAPAHQIDIEFYNQEKKDMYLNMKRDFETGYTRMTARSQDINEASAISFSFFIKHKGLKPERLVHLYDIAGEVFTENAENEIQQQYDYCQGMILMIDPFSIPSVRAKYEDVLTPTDRAGIGRTDINAVIDVFMTKLHEVTGLSEKKMSTVPLAIVIGKMDVANLSEEFSDDRIEAMTQQQKGINDRSAAMDVLCRQFLKNHGMENFINVIEMNFKYHRFFVLSAIGHEREKGFYQPSGVLEPMAWICNRVDKSFANLWVHDVTSNRTKIDRERSSKS